MSDENRGPDDEGNARPSNDDAAQNAHDENQRAARDEHDRKISDLFGDLDDGSDDDLSIDELRAERDDLKQKVEGMESVLAGVRADNKELLQAAQDAKDAFELTRKKMGEQRKQTLGKFIADLEPTVATLQDDLKALESSKESDTKFAKLVDGVSQTIVQFQAVFNKHAQRGDSSSIVPEQKNENAPDVTKPAASTPSGEETIDSLDRECAALEKKMIDLGTALGRAQSDQQSLAKKLEETRTSLQRETSRMEGEQKFAVEKFVKDLLPALDTLDLGLQAIRKAKLGSEHGDKLVGSVEKTKGAIKGVFNGYGVSEIDPINQDFDENKHEVITTQPRPDVDPGTVVFVHQKGYEVEGRLVRPAKVVVTPFD